MISKLPGHAVLAVALFALCGIVIGFNIPGWRNFTDSGFDVPLFVSSDAFAHAHRLRSFLVDLPFPSLHDTHFNYPEGTYLEWPVGFDYLLALLMVIPAKLAGSFETVSVALPFVPIGLSVLTVLVFFFVARPMMGPVLSFVAALVMTFNGSFHATSIVGALDHHGLEVLSIVLLLGLPHALKPGRHMGQALGLGLALAVCVSCSTLVAYLVALYFGCWFLGHPMDEATVSRSRAMVLSAGLLVVFLAASLFESCARGAFFSITTLSLLQFVLVLGVLSLWILRLFGRPRIAVALCLIGGAFAIATSWDKFLWIYDFVMGGNPFWRNIIEVLPIFFNVDGPTFSVIHSYFGFGYLLSPLVFVALRRLGKSAVHDTSAWFFLILFVLSFYQQRFAHLFVPAFIIGALTLLARFSRNLSRRSSFSLVLATTALLVEPAVVFFDDLVPSRLSIATYQAAAISKELRALRLSEDEGVFASPNFGNAIVWLTGQPVVVNTFFYEKYLEFDFELRQAKQIPELLSIMDRKHLGVLVAADDVSYRFMLHEFFGQFEEADAWKRLALWPCHPAFLQFAYDRLACGTDTSPDLVPIRRIVFSKDPRSFLRQAVIYRRR